MKSLFRTIALVLCLTFIGQSEAFAQPFKSAVGLRLGYPISASFKTFVTERNAVEVYAGYRGFAFYNQINLAGAYQIHNDIESVNNLQWYYGAGAGVNFLRFGGGFTGESDGYTSFSISGYAGLQYTLEDTPVSFTLDWVPTYFFGSVNGLGSFGGFGGGYGALGVRYVLGE